MIVRCFKLFHFFSEILILLPAQNNQSLLSEIHNQWEHSAKEIIRHLINEFERARINFLFINLMIDILPIPFENCFANFRVGGQGWWGHGKMR